MSHDDVAYRWVNRTLGSGRQALKSHNLFDEGDSIYSYGRHFEVARVLRNKDRSPRGYLINGELYSVTTARHQAAVRTAIAGTDLPAVTIPHVALSSAGIDLASIELVNVQPDWWTTTVITKDHLVGFWTDGYRYESGGWTNSLTGEWSPGVQGTWSPGEPEQERCEQCKMEPAFYSLPASEREGMTWEQFQRDVVEPYQVHVRLRHGVWERNATITRKNGHKRAFASSNHEWELIDDPTAPLGYRFEREVQRHWLGASLIRARVPYLVRQKHADCGGTGRHDTVQRINELRGEAEGPLTDWQMDRHIRNLEWVNQRQAERGEEPLLSGWHVDGSEEDFGCRGCSGRGWTSVTRHRTAYFLSGFDTNETRPSYFFCELPPKARPTTVEEAYEALKPESVKLAESIGREVKRQGDIFAIPMPGLTAAELRREGGTLRKRVAEIEDVEVWNRRGSRSRTVRRRITEHRAHILGTNHEASEVFDMPNGQTYARGVLVHEPGRNREPDHKRLSLGKEWHLVVKNTVPTT